MADQSEWIFLGSGSDCEVRVVGQNVATHHARCRLEPNGRVRIEDLGTPGGTAINSPGMRISINYLNPSDTVYLAVHPAPATKVYEVLQRKKPAVAHPPPPPPPPPPASYPAPPPPPGWGSPATQFGPQQLRSERGVTVIGRNPDPMNKQRLVIDSPMASRNHAGLLRTDQDEYYLWDLGSTYGTFLDSQRIGSSRTRVLPHQVISIAGYRFSLGAQGAVAMAAPSSEGIEIRAHGVSAEVGGPWTRRLNLADVRLAVPPKTMLALMGASGAGKTTLLRALAGQAPPKQGRVLYNDLDIYHQFEQVRSLLGYVPQDDILHPQLTVQEALCFSARLRLPTDYSQQEIQRLVAQTMNRLGIAGQAAVLIGSPEKRGISGGQRKRVSLAMELLADPSVLLLDEPTSGLSSTDAERVVSTLRELAREGRTVIVTIHQPSQHVFEMFDRVAVVDNDAVRTVPPPPPQPGKLIYMGSVTESRSYFQGLDSSGASRSAQGAEAIFDAIEGNPGRKTRDWESAFQASPQYRTYVDQPLARPYPSGSGTAKRPHLPSPWHQFSTLLQRLWRIKASDPWAMWQMFVLQPAVVAVGIALVSGSLHTDASYAGADYVRDFLRVGKTLFFLIFTAVWFGCNNTAREVVGELPVYVRERMVGLSLGAYLGSKLAFFAGVAVIQCLILGGICVLVCGLQAGFLQLLFLLWMVALCGVALGLLISTVASKGERAIQLVPLVLLPMILFGGGVTRLADMESGFARSVATVIPARWAFEGGLLMENASRPVAVKVMPGPNGTAIADRFTLVHHYFEESPHEDTRIWICMAILAAFTVVFSALAGVCLKLQDIH